VEGLCHHTPYCDATHLQLLLATHRAPLPHLSPHDRVEVQTLPNAALYNEAVMQQRPQVRRAAVPSKLG